jgi:hypothetical protein
LIVDCQAALHVLQESEHISGRARAGHNGEGPFSQRQLLVHVSGIRVKQRFGLQHYLVSHPEHSADPASVQPNLPLLLCRQQELEHSQLLVEHQQ